MKILFCLSFLLASGNLATVYGQQESLRVISPDGTVELVIESARIGGPRNAPWRYRVSYHSQLVLAYSALGLEIEGQSLAGRLEAGGSQGERGGRDLPRSRRAKRTPSGTTTAASALTTSSRAGPS